MFRAHLPLSIDTNSRFRLPLRMLIAVACLLPGIAAATNGYFPTGYGTKNKGMAGAGAAFPQETLIAATNPAGMVGLGNRLDLGAALFAPDRGFVANDDAAPPSVPNIPPGRYDSANDLFLIPYFGWNKMLNEKSSVGIGLGGNGGMNTEYDAAIWQNFAAPPGTPANPTGEFTATAPTGVDLSQLFLGVTYGRKLTDTQWLGVTPFVSGQRFKATGLEPFRQFSVSPENVTDNGYDYSYGAGLRLGWLGHFAADRFHAGVSYQTKTYMQKFDKYSGLFAGGGDFDLPARFNAGLAYDIKPNLTAVLDFERSFFNDIPALGNPNNVNLLTASPDQLLGGDNGLGFGWDDQDVVKLGLQWDYNSKWTFRGGYAHASKLFDNAQALFNVLAPATVQDHVAVGLTYRFSKKNEISAAFTHAFKNKVEGTNPFFTGQQTGFVEMEQYELEVSWGHRF